MKLVRAKLKPLDQIPKEFACCQAWVDGYLEVADVVFVVDADRVEHGCGYVCMFCGRTRPEATRVWLVKPVTIGGVTRYALILEVFDLDEGMTDEETTGLQGATKEV